MGRSERPLDAEAGPLQRFASDLRVLRRQAGAPSYRQLARKAHYSATALSEAAAGERLPSLAVTLAYARACGGDPRAWEARWRALAAELAAADDREGDGAADEDGVGEAAPYVGLAAFQPEDAGRFVGRTRLVDELVARLGRAPLLAVFGASGSGKSSLLRAGLLPAVWAGRLHHSTEWSTVLLTPGRHPLRELSANVAALCSIAPGALHADLVADPHNLDLALRQALVGKPRAARILLVVDQFEELFTLCRDEHERDGFVAALLAGVEESDSRAMVVLGVRADFYGRCADYPALVEALRDVQVLIGPMTGDELREVVTAPAAGAGLKIEPALVTTVVADVAGRAGALPLLSHALLETWRCRRGRELTLDAYLTSGGVRGAIAQTAEARFAELSPRQQAVVENIMVRLTALGEGTEETRRRVSREELLAGPESADVRLVLDRLAEARLVTLSEDTVEVTHEALIREWPRLRQWLADDREGLRRHRQLTEAAAEWDRTGRDPDSLYRGVRLANALDWMATHPTRVNDLEQMFLAASAEQRRRERAVGQRRVRLTITGLGLALVLITALALWAFVESQQADSERRLALAHQLAAGATTQLTTDPELSVLLARRGYVLRPTEDAEVVLRQAVAESRVRRTLGGHRDTAEAVATSVTGRWIASGSADGSVRVWLSRSGDDRARVLDHGGPVRDVAFTPDERLVSAGDDGRLRIWDLATRKRVAVLSGHDGVVLAVTVSADGRLIASAGRDDKVRIWDAASGAQLAVLTAPDGPVSGVAFTEDGRGVAGTSGNAVRVWDWTTGAVVMSRTDEGSAEGVAASPDGRQVVTAGSDGIVRMWDAAGQNERPVPLRGQLRQVNDVAFSRDGRWVASAGDDGTAWVWDLTGQHDPIVLRGHRGPVRDVAFGPGGTRVVTAGYDGTVRVWAVVTGVDARVLRGHERSIGGIALSQDARRMASASDDGTVRIWDVAGRTTPVVVRGHTGPVYAASFTRDGRWLASASDDGTVRVWDLTGAAAPRVLRHGWAVFDVEFSSDGRRLATAVGDGTVHVWDLSRPADPVVLRGHRERVFEVAFSPDGRRVASASDDGTVRVWDLTPVTRSVVLAGHQGPVGGVAFSLDGRNVASTGHDGTVRVWDLTRRSPAVVLAGHDAPVNTVRFSPDGRRLVTGGGDGTVRIWDPMTARQLLTLRGHTGAVYGVAFGTDGRQVISAGEDANIRVWTCEVCGTVDQVLALAAERVTRDLTAEERRTFVVGDGA